MPWKKVSVLEERRAFVRQALRCSQPLVELCRDFGISRKTGYKWLRRFEEGGRAALADRSRRPARTPHQTTPRWIEALSELRERRQSWGAKKLHAALQRAHPRARLPVVRTFTRWLCRLGFGARRRPKTRKGPTLPCPPWTPATRPNEVWTMDFKGWFRTADGSRCEPLTVRDLFSRYLLTVTLLEDQSDQAVRRVLRRLFLHFGLPRAIRVDNGAPFAGKGALGLSRLSLWWLKLGIRVEFSRRARPGDNAAHEQMHRVLKAETLRPVAATRRGQQNRTTRWLHAYNQDRPHEALGQKVPAAFYRKSPRPLPAAVPEPHYDPRWKTRRVRPHGDIKWQGRLRFIGRAFVGERIGLQASDADGHEVYFGAHLIGTLHRHDPGGMRPAMLRPPHKPSQL